MQVQTQMTDSYRDNPALGATDVKHLASGYKNYLNSLMPDYYRSTSMLEFGTAVHTAILEPDRMMDTVAIIPECDRRTKAGKAVYNQFLADNPDKILITHDDWQVIRAMTVAVRGIDYEPLRDALLLGEVEKEGFKTYTIPDTKDTVDIKGRADLIDSSIIWDLKTTNSIDDVHATIKRLRYDIQACHYMEIFNLDIFILVFVEKSLYPRVKLVQMNRHDLARTHIDWIHALRNYTEQRNPIDLTSYRAQ